jgi:hypothetical protein
LSVAVARLRVARLRAVATMLGCRLARPPGASAGAAAAAFPSCQENLHLITDAYLISHAYKKG